MEEAPTNLKLVVSQSTLTKESKLAILADTAQGLGYLHARELLHRDVKPSNILIFPQGHGITAKLGDFGLVTPNDDTVSLQGSFRYMPDDVAVTPRWDVFSFSILSMELLFGFTTRAALIGRQWSRCEDKQMASVLAKGSHPDASQRFDSVQSLHDALSESTQPGCCNGLLGSFTSVLFRK
jgi:serine/threonine protein kinase